MPTQAIPDLTPDQLAELSDRMKAAERERDQRQRVEAAHSRNLRAAQEKLARIESELSKIRADEDIKVQTVAYLRERLAGVEELPDGSGRLKRDPVAG